MIEVAKRYKEFGLNLLPTKADKSPALISWKYLITNFISDSEIETNLNSPGIGVICGKISGNLEVIDVDNHFGTAFQNLSDFAKIPEVKQILDKYLFPVQLTQGGGYHLIYRCSGNINGSMKLASIPKWSEKQNRYVPDAIFETKGEGGYIVASPTKGYKFIKGDFINIPVITSEEREVLLDACRSFNEFINEPEKKALETTGDRLGDKYNADDSNVYEVKKLLKDNGWTELSDTKWRRDGKSKGISATFGKVAKNVFYNFSANGYPFEPNRAYNLFSIYAILNFASDFKAAAKSLIHKYGEPIEKLEKLEQKEKKETLMNEIKTIVNQRKIDKNKIYDPPIPILSIRKNNDSFYIEPQFVRLMTEANISVITGKAKSKKTFLQTLFTSALISNSFSSLLRSNLRKPKVIYIDTEQAMFDVYMIADRVKRISTNNINMLDVYNLRGVDYHKNIEVLRYLCEMEYQTTSVIIIDQVADFLRSVNNEEEAVAVVKILEKLSYDYKLHISCVVHQNKSSDYATGWLGTQLMKKAETIIKVTKDVQDKRISVVEPDMMRGEEFEPFSFYINENGLPELVDGDVTVYADNNNGTPF